MTNISIVIPTHNDARFLSRCLDSIRAQTIRPSEIIIVDDGTDLPEALEILQDMTAEENDVRLIRRQHSGAAAARNAALHCVEGEFVVFMDVDDELREDCLQVRYGHFEANPEISAAFSGYISGGNTSEARRSFFKSLHAEMAEAGDVGRRDGIPGGLPLYMFRTEALRSVKGLDESLDMMEDFDLIVRLIRRRLFFSGNNEPLYLRNFREGSLTRSSAHRRLAANMKFLAKARRNRYFTRSELIRRYASAFLEFIF